MKEDYSQKIIEESLAEAVFLLRELYQAGNWVLKDPQPWARDDKVYWDEVKEMLKQHRIYNPDWKDIG